MTHLLALSTLMSAWIIMIAPESSFYLAILPLYLYLFSTHPNSLLLPPPFTTLWLQRYSIDMAQMEKWMRNYAYDIALLTVNIAATS